ncbi:MAG: peptidylprolyl isomerase [Coriobacteriia bacterium]|nr:peptidylprolyl isomerase [Coriobacteriia bacterium]MCL2750483.1 peptidylprolyl isomerase [Coriobacteriia bacterium]
MKRFAIIALCAVLCLIICFAIGCTPGANNSSGESQSNAGSNEPQQGGPLSLEDLTKNIIQATIIMEDGGIIILELYPDLAPQSVRNFVYLARQGFYDGLTFHRIMKDFMIQGGDPTGTGGGGPGYSIKGEFQDNNITNDLSHERGVLSMARSNDYDSAGSQFFIMHGDSYHLDGQYAAFGRVIQGMDVVDRIANTPNSGANGAVAEEDKPVIKSITIDSNIQLPEPDKLR